jgi:hypothetical protein
VHHEHQRAPGVVCESLPIETEPCKAGKEDFAGRRFGTQTVIGYAKDHKGKLVVRCVCGNYSIRKPAIMASEHSERDCCEDCYRLRIMKKREVMRRTGKQPNTEDFK